MLQLTIESSVPTTASVVRRIRLVVLYRMESMDVVPLDQTQCVVKTSSIAVLIKLFVTSRRELANLYHDTMN